VKLSKSVYSSPIARRTGLVLLIGLLYWVYGSRPIVVEVWQWADDGLYLGQAEGFLRWLHGDGAQWLGPYSPLVLSKVPFFAIAMGLLNLVHIPLRLAEFALLMSLPWFFRASVRPVMNISSGRFALISVVLVALPFLPQSLRLLRYAFQAGLGSACLIASVGLILRSRRDYRETATWAGLVGITFGLCYLTREETVWLLPVVLCACASALVGAWTQKSVRSAAGITGAAALTFFAPVLMVCALNHSSYGYWGTTVRRAPAFTRAHQLMTSLEPSSRERFVPITTATRLLAYKQSPSFARLQPFLEGKDLDSLAANPAHLSLNGRKPGTREYFVSTFEFALEKSAFEAGAHTAAAAEELFAGIANELSAAIEKGQLHAGNSGPAILAAPMPGDVYRIIGQTRSSLAKLYTLDAMVMTPAGFSSGSEVEFQRMSSMTLSPLRPKKESAALVTPEIGRDARITLYRVITKLEMVVYALSTLALLVFPVVVLLRRDWTSPHWEQAFAGLVLCGSLLAFSVSMATVDVLGFPMLQWSFSYNSMGFIPLSVLGAFGLLPLFAWYDRIRGVHSQPA
jgi:hypothetical protein